MTYAEQVVGTVGRLFVEPNGANVVPGRVVFDFEIRSLRFTGPRSDGGTYAN